jgi:hypothetical protein
MVSIPTRIDATSVQYHTQLGNKLFLVFGAMSVPSMHQLRKEAMIRLSCDKDVLFHPHDNNPMTAWLLWIHRKK